MARLGSSIDVRLNRQSLKAMTSLSRATEVRNEIECPSTDGELRLRLWSLCCKHTRYGGKSRVAFLNEVDYSSDAVSRSVVFMWDHHILCVVPIDRDMIPDRRALVRAEHEID